MFPHDSSLLSSHIERHNMKLEKGVPESHIFELALSYRKFSLYLDWGIFLTPMAWSISGGQ